MAVASRRLIAIFLFCGLLCCPPTTAAADNEFIALSKRLQGEKAKFAQRQQSLGSFNLVLQLKLNEQVKKDMEDFMRAQ